MSGARINTTSKEFTVHNKIELIEGGKLFFDRLIAMINNARESIHIQVYIFDDDETGKWVAEALKAAARRNVNVYVLVDGYASRRLSKSFIKDLRNAGVHFRFFEPLFRTRKFYFGRRLHHKIFVADTTHAFVGGVNISNNYNDLPGKKAWLDFAVYIEGEAAQQLCTLCWKTWNNFPLQMGLTPCEQKQFIFDDLNRSICQVALRRNDWVRRKNQISSAYSRMFLYAKKEIIILSSYFLPGRFMRRQLAAAAARGIKIKVITAGVSDIPIAKHAERYIYNWLLNKKIELFEFEHGILHGKIAVSDDQTVSIGSYNINDLSAYASIELNVEVADKEFARSARVLLNHIIDFQCRPITIAYHSKSSHWLLSAKRWIMFNLIQVGLFLSTFYLKHTVPKRPSPEQSHQQV